MTCGHTASAPIPYTETLREDRQPWLVLLAWLDKISRARSRSRQHRQLLELSDHLLADIGVSREQAMAEARKSGWIWPNIPDGGVDRW